MPWGTDPELHQMFVDEVGERATRLRAGAAAMRAGRVDLDLAGVMVREGHTVKGTGRVMGHGEIAAAGLLLEEVWRRVQQGSLPPGEALAEALDALAEALPAAVEDPSGLAVPAARLREVAGVAEATDPAPAVTPPPATSPGPTTAEEDAAGVVVPFPPRGAREESPAGEAPEEDEEDEADEADEEERVEAAADAAGVLTFGAEMPGPRPRPVIAVAIVEAMEPVVEETPAATTAEAPIPEPPPPPLPGHAGAVPPPPEPVAAEDLGGLLGALETWATSESVPVSAGRLYRLINGLAAARIDLEALEGRTVKVVDRVRAGDAAATAGIEQLLAATHVTRGALERLEEEALGLSAVSLGTVTSTLPQLVRYLAKKIGKEVAFTLVGDDLAVDRQVVDRLGEPLRQLVVNAVTHGIEDPAERAAVGKPRTGRVGVEATLEEGRLRLVVTDDGRGVDWATVARVGREQGLVSGEAGEEELRALLYSDGFTTLAGRDDLAGDGSGLARVREAAEDLYGTFTLETSPGRGTAVTLTVPACRALQRALLVEAGGQLWGIPETAVADVVPLGTVESRIAAEGRRLVWGDTEIPIVSLAELVGMGVAPGIATHLVIVTPPTGALAVGVEGVAGSREVAAKELGPLLSGPDVVSGVALLGGDEMALLVDVGRLAARQREVTETPIGPIPRVLVVDDSRGVQQVVSGVLVSSGFATLVAGTVAEALSLLGLHDVDAIVVDFSMPRADGVALTHMVRQRYGDIPVVMLSGVAEERDRRRAMEAGVDAFFEKGDLREGALAATLRALIARRGAPGASAP